MSTKPDFSIIIPVYNEEQNLERLLREVQVAVEPMGRAWEILFVDDGSTDTSLDVIRKMAGTCEQVRYLAFEANQGQSAAFAAGFDHAGAPLVITMDADLQNDPRDIPKLLERHAQGDCQMVIGWRAERKDTWIKRISSKFANALRRKFTGDGVHDTGCSLKVMEKDYLDRLPRFKNMHRFLPALMQAQGAEIAEVVVHHRPRVMGESKYGTWDRAKAGAYDLIGVQWLLFRNITYRVRETDDTEQ